MGAFPQRRRGQTSHAAASSAIRHSGLQGTAALWLPLDAHRSVRGPCIDGTGYDERAKPSVACSTVMQHRRRRIGRRHGSGVRSAGLRSGGPAPRHDSSRAGHHQPARRLQQGLPGRDAIGIAHEGDLLPWSFSTPTKAPQDKKPAGCPSRRSRRNRVHVHLRTLRPPHAAPLAASPVPVFDGLQTWLDERRGSSVEVRTPQRGDLENLATLARQNAEIQLQRMANKSSGSLEQRAADEGAKTWR